ncbi:MAG TPA: hypothetical protein VGJ73_07720, partial [Verrucomicrobiae bacterium]
GSARYAFLKKRAFAIFRVENSHLLELKQVIKMLQNNALRTFSWIKRGVGGGSATMLDSVGLTFSKCDSTLIAGVFAWISTTEGHG